MKAKFFYSILYAVPNEASLNLKFHTLPVKLYRLKFSSAKILTNFKILFNA